VSYIKSTSFTILTALALTFALVADETDNEAMSLIEEPATAANEPRIRAQLYSPDAIQAIERLTPLVKQEPESNKILLKLENFPKKQEILLEVKRLASVDPKAYEHKVSLTIQDDGSMLINGTEQKLQTIISHSSGYLPGERVFYRFRSIDGQVDKEISGISTPAVLRNKNHEIVLKAELASVNPTAYKIFLPMMEDGEQFELKSTSVGDIAKAKPKYAKNKPFLYAPAPNGKSKGGDAILEIKRKTGQVYAIRLPWGSALEGYHNPKKVYSPKP